MMSSYSFESLGKLLKWICFNREIQLAAGPIIGAIAGKIALEYCHNKEVSCVIGLCLWMVIWWLTEVVRMGITGLLPMVMLPLLGVKEASDVSTVYFSDTVIVCWGSIIMTIAIEKHDLHNIFAERYLKSRLMSLRPHWLLLGFIASTGFLSMWMSNTATTALMCPLARAVILELHEIFDENMESPPPRVETGTPCRYSPGQLSRLATAIDIGISFAATLGGMATLTGTGANLVLQGTMNETFGPNVGVSYLGWLMISGPVSLINLLLLWWILIILYLSAEESCIGKLVTRLAHKPSHHQGHPRSSLHSHPQLPTGSQVDSQDDTSQKYLDTNEEGVVYTIFNHADSRDSAGNSTTAEGSEQNTHLESPSTTVSSTGQKLDASRSAQNASKSSASLDYPSSIVVLTFAAMAALWMTRDPPGGWGWSSLFTKPDYISDGTVAMSCCLFLFCVPNKPSGLLLFLYYRIMLPMMRRLFPSSISTTTTASGNAPTHGNYTLSGIDDSTYGPDREDTSHAAGIELGSLPGTSTHATDSSQIVATDIDTLSDIEEEQELASVLGWSAISSVNWDIVFLLGGGFALSKGFQASGLSALLTRIIVRHKAVSLSSIALFCSLLAICLTNIMSNVATANILLPSIACVGPSRGKDPLLIMTPVTMAVSLALVLPIGTPPNAIILANKNVSLKQLAVTGLLCSVVFLSSIFLYCYFVLPMIVGGAPSSAELEACS